jgi:hypothetical protein
MEALGNTRLEQQGRKGKIGSAELGAVVGGEFGTGVSQYYSSDTQADEALAYP